MMLNASRRLDPAGCVGREMSEPHAASSDCLKESRCRRNFSKRVKAEGCRCAVVFELATPGATNHLADPGPVSTGPFAFHGLAWADRTIEHVDRDRGCEEARVLLPMAEPREAFDV